MQVGNNNPFSKISLSKLNDTQFGNPFGQRAINPFAREVNQVFSSNCFKVTTPDDNNSQFGSTGPSFGGNTGPSFGGNTGPSFGGNTGPSFGGSTGPSFEGFDNNAFFDDNEFVESSPDDEFNDFGVNNNSDFSEIEGDEVDDVAEFGKLVNFERDNDAQFGGNQIKSSNSGGDAIPHKNQSAENETFKDLQKEVNSNSQDFGSKIEEAFEDGKISEKQKNTLYDEKIKNIMDKSKQEKEELAAQKKEKLQQEVAKTRKALIANNLANTAIRKGVEDERGFAKFLIDNDYLPAVDDMLKQVFDKFNEKLNEKLKGQSN